LQFSILTTSRGSTVPALPIKKLCTALPESR
jgi:hypothetical protein